ncbi:MAG: MFS transporter [Bacteroidetes bacterium]|nr:MAG: MFS transporter [Bacteroidota bacterium]
MTLTSQPTIRFFLAARFLFIMALQMVTTGLGWYLYEITANPLALGWMGLAEVVPAIGLALYAGHIIDISNKRNVLLRGMCLFLLAVVFLALVTSSWFLHAAGAQFVALAIYGIIFFTGVFRAFTGPTFNAILAQLVQKEHLPRAVNFSTTAWQSAAVLGPVVAGLLIGSYSLSAMFSIALVLLTLSCISAAQLPHLPVQHSNINLRTWESVKEGLAFVKNTKIVLSAISIDMFAVLFGGATAMLPVFAKDILHVGASGMGFLRAAQGIGTVLVLFVLAKLPLRHAQGRTMLLSVAAFGLCMVVFALSKSFWLSFAAIFFSGVFDGISVLVRGTIMQLYVPDGMRGRVSSVNSMFINSSNEMGQFESGMAARLLGTVPSVVFGGCMTLLVVAVAWFKAPALKKLNY